VHRLRLALGDRADWVKVFDPRAGGLFVATAEPPAVGADVGVDLTMGTGGPRVILHGSVLWRREGNDPRSPAGCSIGIAVEDREKVNFLNGYVRGGLLNRRERRRLPVRLPVSYGGVDSTEQAVTRDINEEGCFIVTESPLPEDTQIHVVLSFPGGAEIDVRGVVSHTVVVEDEDVPGMGVRYTMDEGKQKQMTAAVDRLEASFLEGSLPEDVIG
jgi:uncharacterized protein (TIGR02266 family)